MYRLALTHSLSLTQTQSSETNLQYKIIHSMWSSKFLTLDIYYIRSLICCPLPFHHWSCYRRRYMGIIFYLFIILCHIPWFSKSPITVNFSLNGYLLSQQCYWHCHSSNQWNLRIRLSFKKYCYLQVLHNTSSSFEKFTHVLSV